MENNVFHKESRIDKEEKLALLSFLTQEFDLNQFLPLAGPNLRIITKFAYQEFARRKTKTDLIYCDFSGHSECDPFLLEHFCDLLSNKGILCIDGFERVEQLNYKFQDNLHSVMEIPGFSILARRDGTQAIKSISYQVDLFRRKYFLEKERIKRNRISEQPPLVTVIILTYNHEKYITECLDSVLIQQGDFRLRIIIIDDASSDQTAQVVRKNISGRDNDRIEIEFRTNQSNCGVVNNLATSIRMALDCDYLTFCEGDDYWSSATRIQEHLYFLAANPECVMSFNTIELCSADGNSKRIHHEHVTLAQEIFDGNSLAAWNFIGNFSACFYDGALTKILPANLFDMYTVDWMFNLYCSQFGGIGYLQKPLTVYRQHKGGEWSSRKEFDKMYFLGKLIDQYNLFLDFQYDKGFQKYRKVLLEQISINYPEQAEKFDLLIFDDVFPAPCSCFRFSEFTTYLREIPGSRILTSGLSLFVLGDESLDVVTQKFQRSYPELGNKVMESNGAFPVKLGKLLYVNFLSNAYALLQVAEEAKVPFAFTLYPGGGFVLNNLECDRKLKRIFDSPCFRKVIVTQQITYDYLISKSLCSPGKVDFIFGVVMMQDAFVDPIPKNKARWGFGKKRLDICFMAHRYTPHGEDKGYDVFINMACHLRKMYDNIYFHIVGPYDRRVIDVSPIHDHIEFHGTLNPEQLDNFFKNIDIIMSPNISGKIWPGSFDGFPTASCTEGGLRGVAIFCTDEFNSAAGNFIDGQDFVLIKYNLTHIVHKVDYYYRNPAELKAVGECGSQKILDLYSYKSQMAPRIRILRELIESPFIFDLAKLRSLKQCLPVSAESPLNVVLSPIQSPLYAFLKKHSPKLLKNLYRNFIK